MFRMEVFSFTVRRITDAILMEAFGSVGERNAFSLLRDKGLVRSKGGTGGGCWLTPVGRSIAAKLSEQGVRTGEIAIALPAPAPVIRQARKTRLRPFPLRRAALPA